MIEIHIRNRKILSATIWVLFILIIVLVGCVPAVEVPERGEVSEQSGGKYVGDSILKRAVDREAGWVCWYMNQLGGIFCAPLAGTDLSR